MSLSPSLVVGVTADAARALRSQSPHSDYSEFLEILSRHDISLSAIQWDAPSEEPVQYVYLQLPGTLPANDIRQRMQQLPFVRAAYFKPAGEAPSGEGPPG